MKQFSYQYSKKISPSPSLSLSLSQVNVLSANSPSFAVQPYTEELLLDEMYKNLV